MTMTGTRGIRVASGLLATGLLTGSLAACSGTSGNSAASSTAASASVSGSAGQAGASGSAGAGASASGSAGAATCSGMSCSLTLTQSDANVKVLGNTISLGSIQNGKATLSVAGQSISCTQGQSVTVGPVTLTCSSVTNSSVTLTAALGSGSASSSPTG